MTPLRSLPEVLSLEGQALAALPGVIGVGEGERDGQACVLVLVRDETTRPGLPEQLCGYPVRVEVTGTLRSR